MTGGTIDSCIIIAFITIGSHGRRRTAGIIITGIITIISTGPGARLRGRRRIMERRGMIGAGAGIGGSMARGRMEIATGRGIILAGMVSSVGRSERRRRRRTGEQVRAILESSRRQRVRRR